MKLENYLLTLVLFVFASIANASLCENCKELYKWNADDGSKRTLYHEYLDKKARLLHLKITLNNTSTDGILEGDVKASVVCLNEQNDYCNENDIEKKHFIYKRDIETGFFLRKKITTKASWPNSTCFKVAPTWSGTEVDEKRIFMSLVTTDGIPFYSLYSLPEHFNPAKKYKIAILLGGGTGAFHKEYWSNNPHYLDKATPIDRNEKVWT